MKQFHQGQNEASRAARSVGPLYQELFDDSSTALSPFKAEKGTIGILITTSQNLPRISLDAWGNRCLTSLL